MDILTFLAQLAAALGWPIAIIIMVLILRKPIAGLIPLLQRLKYKDLELDFGRRIEEIKEEVAEELPPAAEVRALPAAPDSSILTLARVSPRAAVLESWLSLEETLMRRAQKELSSKGDNEHPLLPHRAITFLERSDNFKNLIPILKDLRGLRNEAAHAPDFAFSPGSAIEYAGVAERVRQEIEARS
ncbi:MAG: hypothetical protein WBD27_16050 [Pyrinomonadaceae bacterium]